MARSTTTLLVAAGFALLAASAAKMRTVVPTRPDDDGNRLGMLRQTDLPAGFCGPTASYPAYFHINGTTGDGNTTTQKNYFSWYFPSQTGNAADPVFMWLTGGPGCSSMLALLAENGPCTINDDGNVTSPNPYSWNTKAHGVWVDQPPGSGFSTGYGDVDEAEVAFDMYRFIQAFFQAHPELQASPFYIVGESFAGHYVPAIASYLYAANANPPPGDIVINLKGVAIGNGLVQPAIQYNYYQQYVWQYAIERWGKPVVPNTTHNEMVAATPGCLALINQCNAANNGSCASAYYDCNLGIISPFQATGLSPYDVTQECTYPPLCTYTGGMTRFLNTPAVQHELGVELVLWLPCNPIVSEFFMADWPHNFEQDLTPLLDGGLDVLMYYGDDDFICNWLGGNATAYNIAWSGTSQFQAAPMQTWTTSAGTVAGQVRHYANMQFARVYNASHMVPSKQPAVALDMINTFMAGQPLVQ